MDGGLERVSGEGALSLPLVLNEKSARAAGGTQCVAALRGHVVCVSEDRVSGTRVESGWCRGSLGCVRLRGYRTTQIWRKDQWISVFLHDKHQHTLYNCLFKSELTLWVSLTVPVGTYYTYLSHQCKYH